MLFDVRQQGYQRTPARFAVCGQPREIQSHVDKFQLVRETLSMMLTMLIRPSPPKLDHSWGVI